MATHKHKLRAFNLSDQSYDLLAESAEKLGLRSRTHALYVAIDILAAAALWEDSPPLKADLLQTVHEAIFRSRYNLRRIYIANLKK